VNASPTLRAGTSLPESLVQVQALDSSTLNVFSILFVMQLHGIMVATPLHNS